VNDPIVDEIRRIRDAHAAQFNYNLDAMFRDIKEQEKRGGLTFVAGAARQTRPSQVPHSTTPATPVSDHSQVSQGEVTPGR